MNEATLIPEYFQHITYIGIFIWFFIMDQWVPIPEEIILTYLGYIIGQGFLDFYLTLPIAVIGLSLADNSFFWITRSGGLMFQRLNKRIKGKRFEKYRRKMENGLFKTLLTLTFIPKLRFFGPVLASLSGTHWKRFAALDFIVLSIYTAIYLLLGYLFYNSFILIFKRLNEWHHIGFFVTIAVIGLVIGFIIKKKQK
jgi:membrane-associated protein